MSDDRKNNETGDEDTHREDERRFHDRERRFRHDKDSQHLGRDSSDVDLSRDIGRSIDRNERLDDNLNDSDFYNDLPVGSDEEEIKNKDQDALARSLSIDTDVDRFMPKPKRRVAPARDGDDASADIKDQDKSRKRTDRLQREKDDDPSRDQQRQSSRKRDNPLGSLVGKQDDPVSASQKKTADKQQLRDFSASPLAPKDEKRKSSNPNTDDDDNDTTKKDSKSKRGSSSQSSSAKKSTLTSNMSRPQKEILVGAGIILSAFVLVATIIPATILPTISGTDEIASVIEQDQYEQARLMEEALAAAASRCISTDVAGDSALNSTGGGLFAPGESAPVAEVAGMEPNQIMHAQEIVAVGKEMGISEKGIFTALLVAREESAYRNMSNNGSGENGPLSADQQAANIPSSMKNPFNEGLPSDFGYGHGGDHGSVGVLQQQVPWWGTVDELMNPRIAARKFYEALERVDYESMEPAMAGQAVQRSYDPSGNNYRKHTQAVTELYSQIKDTPEGYNWDRYGGAGGDPEIRASVDAASHSADLRFTLAAHFQQIQNSSARLETTDAILESSQNFNSVRGARIVAHRWDYVNLIGGFRPGDPQDHGKGDAIDVMLDDYRGAGAPIGDQIAQLFIDNHQELDVNYVIWQQRIYQPSAGEEWMPMEDRGSDTENHFDHVHVSFFPSDKYNGQEITDIDAAGGSSSTTQKDSGISPSDLTPRSGWVGADSDCGNYTTTKKAGSQSSNNDIISREN